MVKALYVFYTWKIKEMVIFYYSNFLTILYMKDWADGVDFYTWKIQERMGFL